MKTRIFVVLFVFLLAAVSPAFAGDQKPFEGWAQTVSWEVFADPSQFSQFLSDYPDFEDILIENSSWTPLFFYGQLIKFQGHTNIGGKTTWESPQLVYYFATGNPPWSPDPDPLIAVLFGDTTMTLANGDQIFTKFQGVFYEGHGQYISSGPVLGGTGRFEGATGSITALPGLIKNDQEVMIFEGTIETVGEAKEE